MLGCRNFYGLLKNKILTVAPKIYDAPNRQILRYGNDDANLNQISPFYRKSKNFDIK